MSVFAYVQSAKNDGMYLLAKDGELKNSNDIFLEYMPKIKEFFILAHDKVRPTYIQNKDQHIFVGFHKEKDNSNRRREFLISWNTTDSKEMILETVKKIGVADEFNYDSLEQNKSKPKLLFYILIIAVVMILYKLFQK